MNKFVPIKEAISFGWHKTFENIGLILASIILFMLISQAPSWFLKMPVDFFAEMAKGKPIAFILNVISIILSVAVTIWGWIIGAGIIKIFLSVVKEEKIDLKDLFFGFKIFHKIIGANLLVFVIILPGVALFVIPMFFWVGGLLISTAKTNPALSKEIPDFIFKIHDKIYTENPVFHVYTFLESFAYFHPYLLLMTSVDSRLTSLAGKTTFTGIFSLLVTMRCNFSKASLPISTIG